VLQQGLNRVQLLLYLSRSLELDVQLLPQLIEFGVNSLEDLRSRRRRPRRPTLAS
jgi:hypothetical protein